MSGRRLAAAAVVIALALTGCGGSTNGISAAARTGLAPLVLQVRRSAQARDPQAVRLTLAVLRSKVKTYQDKGEIGAGAATEILAAATEVQSRLTLITTTTTTTTTTTMPQQKPKPPPHHPDKKHGG